MEEIKVNAELKNNELTDAEKKKLEIADANAKVREEAKKTRRPSPAMMAEEIRLLAKKTTEAEDPSEARIARAVLGVFLRELLAHKFGKHVEVAKRLQTEMKDKRPLHLRQDNALALANAAIRYEITFGRVAVR